MANIFDLKQIKEALKKVDLIKIIEEGFVSYSQGHVVVPPIGEMTFDNPPGDVHIKYGFIKNDDYYVIKIASGFYENSKLNLPSSNGMMLLFNQKTGELCSILLDEGYLTDIRTAVAGAISAKYLAPQKVERIGIIGSGIQAKLQLEYLQYVQSCKSVLVWGIDSNQLKTYKIEMEALGYKIEIAKEKETIPQKCNLIVTATPSKTSLVNSKHVKPGTHITAMGSDTPEKNELDPEILKNADIVVADSISQCLERGEIFHAIKQKKIKKEILIELGNVITDNKLQRKTENQITVADLTGVAVQDIQIAKAVYNVLTA
jgi:ornithine cyclodeaminase